MVDFPARKLLRQVAAPELRGGSQPRDHRQDQLSPFKNCALALKSSRSVSTKLFRAPDLPAAAHSLFQSTTPCPKATSFFSVGDQSCRWIEMNRPGYFSK